VKQILVNLLDDDTISGDTAKILVEKMEENSVWD